MTGLSQPYLELDFRPDLQLVSVVRRFVSQFYERVLAEPEVTARMALATHELLDNAASYSADGATKLSIVVSPSAESASARPNAMLTIRISNHADPTNIASIHSALGAMRNGTDPFTHLQEVMRKVARRAADDRSGHGLGLARIWAEADMTVKCEVQGSYICVVAQAQAYVKKEFLQLHD